MNDLDLYNVRMAEEKCFKWVSPCENCVSWSIDINSREPYVCIASGYHSWSPEFLIDGGCRYGRKAIVQECNCFENDFNNIENDSTNGRNEKE